jgi:hypothetical protein
MDKHRWVLLNPREKFDYVSKARMTIQRRSNIGSNAKLNSDSAVTGYRLEMEGGICMSDYNSSLSNMLRESASSIDTLEEIAIKYDRLNS